MRRSVTRTSCPPDRGLKPTATFTRRRYATDFTRRRYAMDASLPYSALRLDAIRHARSGESQRDSVLQPRVARNELPWVDCAKNPQP